jgi:predicted O-linked N-acetylglucosamine transferase (SPINDLY family)
MRRKTGQGDALACHDRALAADPALAAVHFNRGNALLARGQVGAALGAYRRAIALAPEHPERWLNLAHAARLAGDRAGAFRLLNWSLRLAPDFAHAHVALSGVDDPEAGRLHRRAALALEPGLADVLRAAAGAARAARIVDEALRIYRWAFRVDPSPTAAMSDYLTTLLFAADVDGRTLAHEHRRIGQLIEAPFSHRVAPHLNSVDPGRRLRLGLIAPTFRRHVSNASLLPCLRELDRSAFELHLFAHLTRPDPISDAYRALATGWHRIETLDDDRVATAIRSLAIDVLVHPLGHWPDARVAILARKPAPLQVAYMLNAPTLGLEAVDATIVDRQLDPEDVLASLSTERVLHLPGSFVLMSNDEAAISSEPPLRRNGYPTFGSFNDTAKLNARGFALWRRVLDAVPDARLVIKGAGLDAPGAAARLRELAGDAGLDQARLFCRGFSPTRAEHLALIDQIDVMLDTVPFPGGASTYDALWMGVPVVALPGDHPMRRAGAATLGNAGASELVAKDETQYVEIARALAGDPDRLAFYRRTLRARLRASPLMDAQRHARELGDALRDLWREWCAAQART